MLPAPITDEKIVATLFGDGPAEGHRARMASLIEAVAAVPQVDCPVTHHWAPHLYVREIMVPKGTILVGKVHRHAHLAVMLRGDMTFMTKQGSRRVSGSCVLPLAEPYTQRAGYAHEDTVVLNMHPTDKTDLAEIEADVIAPDFDEVGGDELVSELLDQVKE